MAHRTVFPALAVVLLGCGGAHDGGALPPPGEPPVLLYVGATTDEALARLLDQPARDDSAHRLEIDTPAAGALVDPALPAVIAFHTAGTARALPPRPAGGVRRGPAGALAELLALLGPIRAAHAHGIPFNGTGYLLEIDDAAGRVRLRVFTDRTSYTPDAALWADLAAATPQPLKLTITWAAFDENEIPAGGGPFVGATRGFGRK